MKMRPLLFILSFFTEGLLAIEKYPSFANYNMVKTPAGMIRGTEETIGNTYKYFAYRGIRYGQNTGGENRFKKPVPVGTFNDVYDALEYGDNCPQSNSALNFNISLGIFDPLYHQRKSEDCLFLNVFTPVDNTTKKAVIVYLFPGGEMVGTASAYSGFFLASYMNVIFVAMNFRVNAFGFLTTGDSIAPGNYGLFDQLLALHWVKENIGAFGGDPNRVTLFGTSSSAYEATLHAVSPLSGGAGLIHRIFAQGGNAFGPKTAPSNPLQRPMSEQQRQAKDLGLYLGCNVTDNPDLTDSKLLVDCLRRKSMEEILEYNIDAQFMTSIDGEFLPDAMNSFSEDPESPDLQSFKDVDVMLSSASNDGQVIFRYETAFIETITREKDPYHLSKLQVKVLLLGFFPKLTFEELRAVYKEYIVDTVSPNTPVFYRDQLVQALTDYYFVTKNIYFAETHEAMRGTKETWFLYFDHAGKYTTGRGYGSGKAAHSAGLEFVLGWPVLAHLTRNVLNYTDVDVDLSRAAMTFVGNYAKYGNPNGKRGETSLYSRWPPYTIQNKGYMYFGDTSNNTAIFLEGRKNLRPEAARFWNEYIPGLRANASFGAVHKVNPSDVAPSVQAPCQTLSDRSDGYFWISAGQAKVVMIIFTIGIVGLSCLTLILLCSVRNLKKSLKKSRGLLANTKCMTYA